MGFLVRFLFRNLKGYRFLVFLIFVATIFEALASSYAIVVFKDIVNVLAPPPHTPLPEPTFPFNLVLNLFSPAPHGSDTIVIFLIIVLVVLGLLDAGFIYFQLFLTSRVAQNLSARLRKKLFDQLQRLSLDWHGKQKKGDLVQRITGDIANVEKLVTDGLVDSLGDILILVVAVYFMWTTQWQLAFSSIVLVHALAVTIFSYTKAIKARSEEHTSELQSRLHLVCRLLLEKKKHVPHLRVFVTFCRSRRNPQALLGDLVVSDRHGQLLAAPALLQSLHRNGVGCTDLNGLCRVITVTCLMVIAGLETAAIGVRLAAHRAVVTARWLTEADGKFVDAVCRCGAIVRKHHDFFF